MKYVKSNYKYYTFYFICAYLGSFNTEFKIKKRIEYLKV